MVLATSCGAPLGCSDPGEPSPDTASWQLMAEDLPGALLSVWGTDVDDIWVVGADARDGSGPMVLHADGARWQRLDSGEVDGTLWWVHGFAGGPVFLGGSGGRILRYADGEFERMNTPGSGTVFGLWGSAPDDMWAVGGDSESSGGFAWRLSDDEWQPADGFPQEIAGHAALWKVFGRSAGDVWLVGSSGVALHWDGDAFSSGDTGVGSSLFTVHGNDDRYVAVGGLVSGIIVERDLGGASWENVTPEPAPYGLAGVCASDHATLAVGSYGVVLARDEDGWEEQDLGFALDDNLHGVWLDPQGGVWAVGGQTFSEPLTDGVIIHRGQPISLGGL